MGAVFRATNLLLDFPVAVKLIRADLDRGELRSRLQLEARAAARLGHPAIVRVFDVGETESGDPFIVMELLHGETLAQLIERGPLSGVAAVKLLLPIIDALSMAHARGIVHRDLKPDNVLLAEEDGRIQPKILDFGIAKLIDQRDLDRKLTEVGTIVGSPDYMSPEQARGLDDVDEKSDIWSVCVVLYEAMTGKAPFSGGNYNALLRAIVEDAPHPFASGIVSDETLWHILERGLAKDRRQRFTNMSELGSALARWLTSHGIREDVCGTSLASKWLSEIKAEASSEAPAKPADSWAPASEAGNTGIVRGPFTATIRPARGERRATLAAVAGVCALLAVSLLAVNRHAVHSAESVNAATLPPSVSAKTHAKAEPLPPEPPSAPAPSPATTPAALASTAVLEAKATPAEATSASKAKPNAPRPVRVVRPMPNITRFTKPAAVNAAQGAPEPVKPEPTKPTAAKTSAPPLDLLAPY